MGKLINIDNGGTLTDIWVLDGEDSYHTKTITTPYDLSKCFFEGLKKISEDIYGREDLKALLQSTDHIRYSTTQGTNALVERKGPSLGVIINGSDTQWCCETEQQSSLFSGLIGERIAVISSDLGPEDYQHALREAVNHLSAAGASRLVVSYCGDNYVAEEEQLRKAMLRAFPRHLLGSVPVLYSSVLSRDEKPNTRLWTAIFNAFLHPAMERFLYNTENELSTFRMRNPLLVYRNDGYSGRVAKTIALKTYSSGPRGGAEGALAYCQYYGYKRVITIDVGGTTTDIGLIENGQIVGKQRGLVEGVRCSYPLAEIVSVGVGGGSIIKVVDGKIAVGPESVGGAPGPACFGMGGEQATITDALLVMGLLDPKTYFGGKMAIKHEKAIAVINSDIAQPLNISVEAACTQMLDAWAAKIALGIREYTEITDDTVLMAFGGGGPMGVTAVARSAGVRQVLIPRLSAVFSAHGIGFSDIAHSATAQIDGSLPTQAVSIVQSLVDRVSRDMSTEGYSKEECDFEAWYEDEGSVQPLDIAKLSAGSTDLLPHKSILLGVRAVKPISHAQLAPKISLSPSAAEASGERRLVAADGTSQSVPVYQVEKQRAGAGGAGGAVLEEAFWTCSVPAEWRFDFTANRDIVLSFNASEQVQ
tara:strand:+ start:3579 stop:5516 length:1938 start_codon:yes stop_codon:yes gene_type:complete